MQGGGIYSVAAPAGDSGSSSSAGGSGGGRRGGRGGGGASANAAAPTSTPSSTPQRVNFTVRLEIDHAAERRQVFEEAWRVMRNRFYDPKMHGVDWAAAKGTYERLLSDVADSEELHAVIMEMIGELNARTRAFPAAATPRRRRNASRRAIRASTWSLIPPGITKSLTSIKRVPPITIT